MTDRWPDIERQRDRQRCNAEDEDHQYPEGYQEWPAALLGLLGGAEVQHRVISGQEVGVPDSRIEVGFVGRGAIRESLAVPVVLVNRPVECGDTGSQRHDRVHRTRAGILRIRQRGG